MKRREFITIVGGAAAAWPLGARAQQPGRMHRIGVLMAYAESVPEAQAWVAKFRAELQNLGWREDDNIQFDIRWATGNREAIQRFAKELVALQPDLILSPTTPTTAALIGTNRTIPIIFAIVARSGRHGFVASLQRPGGNSPVSLRWSRRSPGSGWSCSRRSRRALTGPPFCSTR